MSARRIILLAALAAGVTAHAAAAADLPKLTISYSQEAGDLLSLWVTLDGGYFNKHGLDVTELLIPAQQGVAALLSGQVQMASLGSPDALSAVAQGAPLKYVVAFAPPLAFELWALPQYATPAKLRGEKVGLPSITGSAYVGTVLTLKQIGLSTSDVILTTVGTAQNDFAAFIAGSIAATVGDPPETFAFEQRGDVMLADLTKSNVPNAIAGLVALSSYIPSHRAIVEDAVAAFVEGLRAERDNKALTEQEIKKHGRITDPTELDRTYEFFARQITNAPPTPDTAMLSAVQQILGARNARMKAVDLASMIDPSFVKAAASRMGGTDRSGDGATGNGQ